jgi:hypothetical protein
VNYATATNGTANSNEYAATSGTLTFAAGELTKTFNLNVIDDAAIDGNKTVKLNLSTPTGGAVLGDSAITVTIFDDETATFGSGAFRFAQSTTTASEQALKAIVTVNRVGGAKGTATVVYSTSNGTALAGSDYTTTSGTLTFLPGEASKTFAVPLVKDGQSEGEESINLTLSSPTGGATLGDPAMATIMIAG